MQLTGRTLGNYRLIERIGQGGMAQVFKAEQQTIGRLVAVKVLHSHLAGSPDFVSRFKREARALGQLQHEHIVRVIDFDVEGELYYMVMDFVPGLSLREYLAERPPLPVDEALDLLAQIASALAYAHAKGTIHRDLKPSNILFRDLACTEAVLTDFGISRLLDDVTLTASGAIVGTPAYMSPEAVQGMQVDRRADIYSLGIILYEMLSGKVPYSGETPLSVIMKQANDPLPPLALGRPDAPAPVVRIVERALAKRPDERFQSADELLDEIRRVRAGLAAPAARPAQTTLLPAVQPVEADAGGAADPPPARPPRRRRPLALLAGLAGVAALGAWAWYAQAAPTAGPGPEPSAVVAVAPTAAVAAPPPTAAPAPTAAPPPAAPAPTAAPPAPTTPPGPAGAAGPLPPRTPGSLGYLRLAAPGAEGGQGFALQLDRVALPPAGGGYVLWLQEPGGAWRRGGPLAVRDGFAAAAGDLGEGPVDPGSRAAVSVEPAGAGAGAEPAGPIVYAGRLSDEHAAAMRRLLLDAPAGRALLAGAGEQAALAAQHAQFSRDALEAGDLADAGRHMEHVINILDGAQGGRGGDLNGDGQAQNPGDGFGVRAYLEASGREGERALAAAGPTAHHQFHADGAQAATAEGLQAIEAVFEHGPKVLFSDTAAEAAPHLDQVRAQLERLAGGPAGLGAVAELAGHAVALGAIPLLDERGLAGEPDAAAAPGRAGLVRLVGDGERTTLALQLERVAPPPPGFHYDAWLVAAAGRRPLFLGRLDVVGGAAALSGEHPGDLRAGFDRLVVSLEVDGDLDLVPARTIVFAGDLAGEAGRELRDPGAPAESAAGALRGADEQAGVALQHAQFLREALGADDLAAAQRHAEHLVNVLDGSEGAAFGDVNLDGQVENPGDGRGVRGHLTQLAAALAAWPERADLTGNQRFYAGQIAATAENSLAAIDEAIAQARKVVASDTPAEALPFVDELERALGRLAQGADRDGSGSADPLLGEGGLRGVGLLADAFDEAEIFQS